MSKTNRSPSQELSSCQTNDAYANMIAGMLTFTSAAQEFMQNANNQAQTPGCHQKLEDLMTSLNDSLKEMCGCGGLSENTTDPRKQQTTSKVKVLIQQKNSTGASKKSYTCSHGPSCDTKKCRRCKEEKMAEKVPKKHKSKLPVSRTKARSFDKAGDPEKESDLSNIPKSNSEPTNKPDEGDEPGEETKDDEIDIDQLDEDIFASGVSASTEKDEEVEKTQPCGCGPTEDECLCNESEACTCDQSTECEVPDSTLNKIFLLRELKKKLNVAENNLMELQKEIGCLSRQMASNPPEVCKTPGNTAAIYRQIMKTTTSIDEVSSSSNVSPLVKRTVTTEEYRRMPPTVPTHVLNPPIRGPMMPPRPCPPVGILTGHPQQYRSQMPHENMPRPRGSYAPQYPQYYTNYANPPRYGGVPQGQPRTHEMVSMERTEIREADSYEDELCGPCNNPCNR